MVDGKISRGRPEKIILIIITEWTVMTAVELIKVAGDREVCKNAVERSFHNVTLKGL